MKNKAFVFLQKICPPALWPFVLWMMSSVFYLAYSRENKALLKKNEALKAQSTGKTAYLLATGPSIKSFDLTKLEGKDCFSVSNFYLSEAVGKICPKYHFIAPYHPPLVYSEFVDWLKDMDAKLPAETGIVLGIATRKTVEDNQLFEAREVHYLGLQKAQITRGIDITKTVLRPQTIPLMAIPFLHYLGYRKVVLIGCDHNILKDYGGTVSNFYDHKQDPRNNATSGNNWQAGIVKHLESARNVFVQYQFYNKIFKKTGRKLVNVSPSGWLDFIEFETFEDAIEVNQERPSVGK